MSAESKEITIHDRPLTCQHCAGKRFFVRTIALNSAGASLLGFESFGSRGAFCYECDECGHLHWFMPQL